MVRQRDNVLFEKLYFFLLSSLKNFQASDPKFLDFLISQSKNKKYDFNENSNIPKEVKIPDLSLQQKNYENLLELLEGVRYLLYYFMPFEHPFNIEVLPNLDRVEPMSIGIQLEDPGLIPQEAEMHYPLVASLIQQILSSLSRTDIYFKIIKPISDQDKFVFFELGYIDKYYQDFSIPEFDLKSTSERELLDEIKDFFSTQIQFNIEEYETDGKLHYKLIFSNNLDLENLYELYVHTAEENTIIAKQLSEETPKLLIRKSIPLEQWQEKPFAVVDCVSNIGYLVNEYVRASIEADKFGGICVHFERIENGWRINCLERIDFDQLFAPLTDWKKRREIYARLSLDPDEFLKRRMIVIQKLKKEHEGNIKSEKSDEA
ncbi:MAG TPA: hypothetical protein VKM55_24185 [Candidatus Lokiarchaeia archaeon]|nr:hypothetical protein [Candidatus Lokiarchaeia archaeon]